MSEQTDQIAGHALIEPRDGLPTACACGTATTATFAEHVEYAIRQDQTRRTAVDVCASCGDIVVNDGNGWAHYRGPGSRLVRCQHTVPYGQDAAPTHAGRYFPLGLADEIGPRT